MKKAAVPRNPGKWDIKRILLVPVIFIFVFSLSASNPVPAPHPAQEIDLVKLKKEEEERRKKLKEQKKKSVVVTNETLKQYEDETKKGDKKKTPAKTKKPVTPVVPKKEDPKKTKEYWQKLKNDLEQRISDLKKHIEAAQLKLNHLTTEHLINDMPGEKEKLLKQKQDTQRLLEGQKALLVQLEADLDALSEKARKAGVPPGWLR